MSDDWRPTADLDALHLRARLNRLIRDFFEQRSVLEVETPILSEAGNTDPNIESLLCTFDGPVGAGARRRWLRTSPEYPLKRLLAAGIGDCYELARVFRNGEAGRQHNPEFTLLEWYRVGWDHQRLIDEVCTLIQTALTLVERTAPVRKLSYRALFEQFAGVDPHQCHLDALHALLVPNAINGAGLVRDDWLNLVLTHHIEAQLAEQDAITVVFDFPATQAALARIRPGDPPLAERFEVYLGGVELANGYHELVDADEQRARFTRDLATRAARGTAQPPIDQRLLSALDASMPACAGVALGVDRLLMALHKSRSINEVLAFPIARA